MKHLRYFLAAAALLAAAACSQADGITSPSSPAAPRHDEGFGGSDGVTSTGTGLPPAPGDTTGNGSVDRGGFIGTGT
jgi:hypothetical protein